MNYYEEYLKKVFQYIKTFLKWFILSVVVGAFGGAAGVLFHFAVDYVTEFRGEHSFMIYFLPVGGLMIAALYRLFSSRGRIDTNRVMEAVRGDRNIPFVMVPLIFISTVITHLFGGSAGREGAALQIGGGIGYNFGKLLKLDSDSVHIITMAGMSSVFAALFGTPVTAAVFALEVVKVGVLNYTGFLACVTASATAFYISVVSGVSPIRFDNVLIPSLTPSILIKVIILAALCAVLSIIFCASIEKCEAVMDKLIHNCYVRAAVGAGIIIILTLAVNTYDYNGAGMHVITRAISGEARYWDFILKIIFTAVTISAGFKGGEIVPTLFIGSTFGCIMASVLGMDAGFAAAIGMVALFCGVVNCPVASIFLAVEIFGAEGILLFGIACAVSYIMSGHSGLYKSQMIVYSKLTAEYTEEKGDVN